MITLIAFALSLSAHAGGSKRPAPPVNPSTQVSPRPTPSPMAPGQVKFEPEAYYSTEAERIKIAHASAKLNEVVQSVCFREFMTAAPLKETNGRTPAQVAEHLQRLSGVVPVEMYSRCLGIWPCTSAVAYRNTGSDTIHLNRNAFRIATPDCEWAATMAHESLGHSLGGYGHSFNWTRQREDTVPYVLGGRKAQYGGDVFARCCKP